MAPFNMRCKTCGKYIYKGKKFNARKETVQSESYLGLPIFRFYIKSERLLEEEEEEEEEEEKRVQKEREDEELNNPMKVLQNRTKDSKLKMEILENLQELKELNQCQAHVDFESMLQQCKDDKEEQKRLAVEEDEQEMKALLEEAQARRLLEDSDSDQESARPPAKLLSKAKPTDFLQEDSRAPGQEAAGGILGAEHGQTVQQGFALGAGGGKEEADSRNQWSWGSEWGRGLR
uniref:Uncharacterized protein n=1 Tax=Sphaerodactylus townsendi TaxID=933632 RepID=A0ACB8EY87_9SAUR